MQDILVYVRDFKQRTRATRYGAQLAAALHASLTGLYACPSPIYVAPAYGPELMSAFLENMRQLVDDAVRSRAGFLSSAAVDGVTDAEWVVAEGDPVDAVMQATTRHDLLVLDHPPDARGSAWDIPGLVLRAGVPCLVLPHHDIEYRPFGRAAIAWNGSPEATRAVHAALPFLTGHEVLLMRGEEREKYPSLEWHPPFDVEAWLRRRGVKVVPHAIDARPDDVGRVLLEEAGKFRADVLVMGAYGRSRFSEWMLGGATRDVLSWAELPLLLHH